MPKDALRDYRDKRSFEATPEPAPAVPAARTGPLLFVVQMHRATRLHYDFRLECDGVLKSWAVPRGPSLNRADKRMAVPTEDHPYDYASFEGVIPPKQYGAGEVIVWDCGVYSPDEEGTFFHDRAEAERQVREGLEKGKLSVLLRGEKLKGSFALVRTKEGWLLIKHQDRFAAAVDVTAQDRSVLCGATVAEMKSVPAHRIPASKLVPGGKLSPMPAKLLPMLAETGDTPFRRAGWIWEPKLDGYRVLAFIDKDGVTLRSRRGLDLTDSFPGLAAELRKQAVEGMILDGEIVAFDAEGRPSFNALQNRAQLKTPAEFAAADRSTPVVYFCFDLLHFAGIDLRSATQRDRRRYLAQCLLTSPMVQLVHATEDGSALHEAALAAGFEGSMAKRLDSPYETGRRSPAWLKVKPMVSAEFVIGGWARGKTLRTLRSVLVGYWDGNKLRYVANVGSGFDDRMLDEMLRLMKPLERKTCPFTEVPELKGPTTWVEPRLVAEVRFQSWTVDDHLRWPIFARLRNDIDPRSVRKEVPRASVVEKAPAARTQGVVDLVVAQLDATKKNAFTLAVGTHAIKLTHLDRVYWPADPGLKQGPLTKRDLLRYLAQVSPFMLPHLADRPLTMIRMPDGIGGQRFYQKHWEQARPDFAETITLWSSHNEGAHDYLVCNNLPTLLWLGQSGTLEFHVWHSRARPGPDCASKSTDYASSEESLEASVLNYPDYVLFDIDPYIYSGLEKPGDEPELNTVAFEKGKEVAFRLRELLQSMKLEPIVKTSGKTGLHVFVPVKRTLDFGQARQFSELVGRHLVRLYPKDVTVEWSVPKRTGKIFMDYNMNVRGKTLNVAYSPRGAPGGPVSMPLTWDELATAHPLDFRIPNAIDRLDRTADRWAKSLKDKQDVAKALNP